MANPFRIGSGTQLTTKIILAMDLLRRPFEVFPDPTFRFNYINLYYHVPQTFNNIAQDISSRKKPFEKKDIKQKHESSSFLVFILIILLLINALCINSGQSVVTMVDMLLWRIVAMDNDAFSFSSLLLIITTVHIKIEASFTHHHHI